MIVQYSPTCHPRYHGVGSLQWTRLKEAGWEVEYQEPIQYFNNCGARATKEFDSLIQGIMEWEMITGQKIDEQNRVYPDKLDRNSVANLDRFDCKMSVEYVHAFTINPGRPNEEVLTGRELKKALKVRINV